MARGRAHVGLDPSANVAPDHDSRRVVPTVFRHEQVVSEIPVLDVERVEAAPIGNSFDER